MCGEMGEMRRNKIVAVNFYVGYMCVCVVIFMTTLLLSVYCVVHNQQNYEYEAVLTIAWAILEAVCSLVSAILCIGLVFNHPNYLENECVVRWVRYLRLIMVLTFQSAVMNMMIAFTQLGLIPALGCEETKLLRLIVNAWPLCAFCWVYVCVNLYLIIRANVIKYNTMDCKLQAVEQGMTFVSTLDIFEQINCEKKERKQQRKSKNNNQNI
eukprot:TRINITY_DN13289_c1_g1_i3.p1 TRINITY_DN13289_c1_g1~~TRINITY_DN13289_c1_g1_i3.p1  ORF type:complete len:211 (+),score=4.90 TRINITY_DN13289_c1_g1_i3:3-635(+)